MIIRRIGHAAVHVPVGLLLKPGTGRDKPGISRPVPPTKTRDGIEFYCKRIRRKGSRLALMLGAL